MDQEIQKNERSRFIEVALKRPGSFGIVGESTNSYGTPVSVLRCKTCGNVVSICPVTTFDKWGDNCLAEDCPSYDINRDMDIMFVPLAEKGFIKRI